MHPSQTIPDEITARLGELSEANLLRVRDYIDYLQWIEKQADPGHRWCYDFVEHYGEADIKADRDSAGMECRAADAISGGVTQPALWEHPPLTGGAHIQYTVPIPADVKDLRLRFATGIRDGAELPPDRYVAFRITVNGWKLWSMVKNSQKWDEYDVPMPEVASDVVRIEFITDGLGDHRWNWAVWGSPRLEGERGR